MTQHARMMYSHSIAEMLSKLLVLTLLGPINIPHTSVVSPFLPDEKPFQLAFLLMNLQAFAEPGHPDREIVDLLFFPTGGGKTEAYLALTREMVQRHMTTRSQEGTR